MKTMVCRSCGKALSYSQFYRRKNCSTYHRECKRCATNRVRGYREQKKAPLFDSLMEAITQQGPMPPGDLAGILGCSHQKAGALARRMYRAGMLEKIPSPMDARYPIWRLPVPSNQPPPAPTRPAPPTPGIHIPMTDDSARELRKLKRESEAKSAGIDDEDLRWMAYYRAQAAQRQQRRQSV